MLAEIMKAFRETGGPLDLNELSRSLGAERSAVEGMLQTLVRQGKLREISPGSEDCTHCGGRADCARLQTGLMGRVYELAEGPGKRR
ncbi:MAG: FeoC-like transcriptional regulator [Chloroflexota bacterium]